MSREPMIEMAYMLIALVVIVMGVLIFCGVGSFVATDSENHIGIVDDIRYSAGGFFSSGTTHIIFEDGYDILLMNNQELGFDIKDNVWVEVTSYLTSGDKITDWKVKV